jgi:hypothetical protein
MSRQLLRSALLIVPLVLAGALSASLAQSPSPDPSLVKRALTNELAGARDTQHPMRYQLRKSSPRLITTKDIAETKDGAVARLIAIDDKPLGSSDEQKEQARLSGLVSDPSLQRHRKQSEDGDQGRALKVLRALPDAFIYQYAGPGAGPSGKVEKFSFKPNPDFEPPDLETLVLTQMTGELWIDPAQARVVRLEGHLQQDIDFGWGILGRLNKGGWIAIDQSDVGNRQWRIVRFQMVMSGRVFFKTRSYDTTEEESRFVPLPVGLGYVQAIQMLQNSPSTSPSNSAQSSH